jgi:hypothetical protein
MAQRVVCQPSSKYLSQTELADLAFGLPSGGRDQAASNDDIRASPLLVK